MGILPCRRRRRRHGYLCVVFLWTVCLYGTEVLPVMKRLVGVRRRELGISRSLGLSFRTGLEGGFMTHHGSCRQWSLNGSRTFLPIHLFLEL